MGSLGPSIPFRDIGSPACLPTYLPIYPFHSIRISFRRRLGYYAIGARSGDPSGVV